MSVAIEEDPRLAVPLIRAQEAKIMRPWGAAVRRPYDRKQNTD